MIVSIHQPEHMPWLGFFYKMLRSDKFVILDSVQYRKNYFQNRNQIVTNGKPNYITATVQNKGHMSTRICDMKLGDPKFKKSYLNKIRESYRKHPYFNIHFSAIEEILNTDYEYLEEMNMRLIEYFRDFLSIETPLIYSRNLNLNSSKDELVLDICKELSADTYIAGISGRDYLDLNEFSRVGIQVLYDEYQKYEYPQYKSSEFVPYMSILDLVMNCNAEISKNIILNSFKLTE